MNKIQISSLIGGAVIIIVLLAVLIIVPKTEDVSIEESENNTSTSTEDVSKDVGVGIGGAGGVIEIIDIEEDIVVEISKPNLDRPVTIPDSYPKDAAKLVATKIADAIVEIEKDNTSFQNWLILGNLRNLTEDYEGAKEIYEYLTVVFPNNSISHTNLGNVYHYHLKEYEKAEKSYLLAIKKNPGNENTYRELHALYKNVYKTETTLAVDILVEGLAERPQSTDFMVLLATYYEDVNDQSNQLVYLEKALAEATLTYNTSLIEALTIEIDSIK